MDDARERKNPRKISDSYSKAANQTNMLSQLSSAWYNLDVDFRRDIPEPSETTTANTFLDQIDAQADIWYGGHIELMPITNPLTMLILEPKSLRLQRQGQNTLIMMISLFVAVDTRSQTAQEMRKHLNTQKKMTHQSVIGVMRERRRSHEHEYRDHSREHKHRDRSREHKHWNREKRDNRDKKLVYIVNEDDKPHYASDSESSESSGEASANWVEAQAITTSHQCRRCHKPFESNNKVHEHTRKECKRQSRGKSAVIVVSNLGLGYVKEIEPPNAFHAVMDRAQTPPINERHHDENHAAARVKPLSSRPTPRQQNDHRADKT
ncbi:hypothetical protein MMC22_011722 [Lobaria immixta]|nr:hypothetical protein [Lobaria immixta]